MQSKPIKTHRVMAKMRKETRAILAMIKMLKSDGVTEWNTSLQGLTQDYESVEVTKVYIKGRCLRAEYIIDYDEVKKIENTPINELSEGTIILLSEFMGQ